MRKTIFCSVILLMTILTGCGQDDMGIKVDVGDITVGNIDTGEITVGNIDVGDIEVGDINVVSSGIFVRFERDDIYQVDLIIGEDTKTFTEDDDQPIPNDCLICLNQTIEKKALSEGEVPFTIVLYGIEKNKLSEGSFIYKNGDKKFEIVASEDGELFKD